MSGARVGEEELTAVGPSRWRRGAVAAAIAVVLVVLLAGGAVTSDFFSAFPRGACKGVGYSSAILGELSDGGPPGSASPEAALAAFAPSAPALGGSRPVPVDGWEQYRGRWVRDLHDGTFYEVDVQETANGWVAGGDVEICGR